MKQWERLLIILSKKPWMIFLSDDINPETCCEKIENVLYQGIQIKADSQPHHHLWLHPNHHAALNGYITLATAYRVCSIDSETDMVKAFDMSRISAAYFLFLACASHHLFSAEPSLVMSAAKFWTNTGESLLDFSRKFSSGRCDVKCTKCHMLETPNSLTYGVSLLVVALTCKSLGVHLISALRGPMAREMKQNSHLVSGLEV